MRDIELIIMALVPAIVLIGYIKGKNRTEEKSTILLAKLFVGGIISTLPAIVFEYFGEMLLERKYDQLTTAYNAISAFLIVALIEELVKFVVLYIFTWSSMEFNYVYDGIIFAVLSSLGFASFENIMYVTMGGAGVAVTRAILSVPGHAIFGVFMGVFYGKSRYLIVHDEKKKSHLKFVLALLVPILLHGTYDFLLFQGNANSILKFLLLVVVMDLVAVYVINNTARFGSTIYRYCGRCGCYNVSGFFNCKLCGSAIKH